MTTATKARATLVEHDAYEGQYGMTGERMIIDHPRHGRLLLLQGFGGMEEMLGGAYRWLYGIAIPLLPDDTLASLSADDEQWQRMTHGYDDDRPVLTWEGIMIEQLARAVTR